MNDLISRQAALDALEAKYMSFGKHREQRAASLCIEAIKNLPSALDCEKCIFKPFKQFQPAHPERKKGRWIKHEVKRFDGCRTGRFFDECSECGKLTPEWRKITEYHRWNYCPNCGADMRGEQDE